MNDGFATYLEVLVLPADAGFQIHHLEEVNAVGLRLVLHRVGRLCST